MTNYERSLELLKIEMKDWIPNNPTKSGGFGALIVQREAQIHHNMTKPPSPLREHQRQKQIAERKVVDFKNK